MSKSRTSKSEFHRRAALARLAAVAQQAQQDEDAAGGDGQAVRMLPLVIKADVQGSAEAVRDALLNLSTEQVRFLAGEEGGET